jgi:anaerobic magnesium-protoporphyrin IX monomethyl ester cyclase
MRTKKILFTHSYFYKRDDKQWKNKQPYPPYATMLAAAFIKQTGFEVQIFDSNLKQSPDEIIHQLRNFQPDYLVIYDDSFNYLSKMCLTVMRDCCFALIQHGKNFGCEVLVNSSDATDHAQMYLEQGADIIMRGEAEQTLYELLTKQNADLFTCTGISFLQNNNVITTVKRPVLSNLDMLPMPAWDLINVHEYKKIWNEFHGYFSLNIATTRGCPFKCNWCAKPIYGNRYNSRSPELVVEEMSYLMKEFNVEHFWICDDIFGLKPNWVKDFSNLLQQKNLKPKLKIQCRADLLLKEETIKNLVNAGLDEVWMGAESGSQKILDAMDKGTTVEQIKEATFLLKKNNVKPCLFIQFGYLNETKDDITKTIKMINELLPHNIGISVSYPLPGTIFFEKVKSQLAEKANWTDSDELQLMFHNTYKPVFYKQLHRYVHKTYRMNLAKKAIANAFKNSRFVSVKNLQTAGTFIYNAMASFFYKQKLAILEKL